MYLVYPCFRVLKCYEDQEDLAAHAFAVFLEDLSVFHQNIRNITSIIAIPRGGACSRKLNDYSQLATCYYGLCRLSKLVEESHVSFVWNRGGCGNLGFRV